MELEGLIFEKLNAKEAGILSLIEERKKEEDLKVMKENEHETIPLKDKLLSLHKIVNDPDDERLAQVEYSADPETGKLIRNGKILPPKEDPFGIEKGMEQYEEFYGYPSK